MLVVELILGKGIRKNPDSQRDATTAIVLLGLKLHCALPNCCPSTPHFSGHPSLTLTSATHFQFLGGYSPVILNWDFNKLRNILILEYGMQDPNVLQLRTLTYIIRPVLPRSNIHERS